MQAKNGLVLQGLLEGCIKGVLTLMWCIVILNHSIPAGRLREPDSNVVQLFFSTTFSSSCRLRGKNCYLVNVQWIQPKRKNN